jgi:hypothetical protein
MPKRMTLSERHLHRLVWAAVQAALMRSPVYRKKPSAAAHEARVQADAAVIESRIGERRK